MFTDSTQWDRVCTFSADKLNELGQVSLFAKKLHALEAEHARDLAKLCEKFLSGVPAEKRGVLERVMAAAAAEQDDGAEERHAGRERRNRRAIASSRRSVACCQQAVNFEQAILKASKRN